MSDQIRRGSVASHASQIQDLLLAIFTSAAHLRSRFPPIPWVAERRQPVDPRIKVPRCPNPSSQCTSDESSTKTGSSERSSLKKRGGSRAPRKGRTATPSNNIQSTARELLTYYSIHTKEMERSSIILTGSESLPGIIRLNSLDRLLISPPTT